MAIITVNQATNVVNLGDFIAEVMKDPKAWVKTSAEIKAAQETLEKAAEASAQINSLFSKQEALGKKEAEIEGKLVKLEAEKEAIKAAKQEAELVATNNAKEAKALAEKLAEAETKNVNLVKAQELAFKETAKAKEESEKAIAKQVELDNLIAKYKSALENLQAASV